MKNLQIEFINYTNDFTGKQSVFYFEDLQVAIDWYVDYKETHKDDDFGISYLSVYGEKLDPTMKNLEDLAELDELHDENEKEATVKLLSLGHGCDLEEAHNELDDCYFLYGNNKVDAYEDFLEETGWFEDVPTHLRNYIDIEAVLRDEECGGTYIEELENCWLMVL